MANIEDTADWKSNHNRILEIPVNIFILFLVEIRGQSIKLNRFQLLH